MPVMLALTELMPELFTRSRRLILNFADIPENTDEQESIAQYFKGLEAQGLDPRLPENRQAFNDRLLTRTNYRYLVSAYGEDRFSMLKGSSIAAEGRTLHLGIDIFSKDLEPVLAPCDGTIVRVGREPETHSFGNFVILQPDDTTLPFLFLGHLSFDLPQLGRVTQGQVIARLGDYTENENGGWSRHLHLQCVAELPPEGKAPLGYGSAKNMDGLRVDYPNPMSYFPEWKLAQ